MRVRFDDKDFNICLLPAESGKHRMPAPPFHGQFWDMRFA
ncbi:hypothetical protein J2W42_002377 [Rhizobium tibeticum]|nr:hypothetical protein [Rhizobium tibeticum]